MVRSLEVVRDRARIQAHLFSLDAKKRWQEVEANLLGLRGKLEQGGEAAGAGASKAFADLTQAAKDLLRELDGTLELTVAVRQVMKSSPVTCSPDDSLNRAAQVLWESNCGAVPVVNAEGNVVGILTDRDICMAAYTRGQPLAALDVASTMSKSVYACTPADSLGHAARIMAKEQVRRLPVLEDGKLVGIVALADIARHIAKQDGNRIPACIALTHTLASISEHRPPAPAQAAE
jgi:CBS domain-containing protein